MLTADSKPVVATQKYPHIVNGSKLTLIQKLVAQLQEIEMGNGTHLNYCKTHKKYYVDYKHTNGETRCPICDEQWLKEHGIHKNESSNPPQQLLNHLYQ